MHPTRLAPAALAGALCMLSACSDSTGARPGLPVSVSFSTNAANSGAASLAPTMGALRSITTTSGTNTLVISRAQVVVARMELERDGATCASTAAAGDDDADEHECAELTVAPTVVDLPVDASLTSPLQITIPAGTYRALEAKIRPIRADGDHGKSSAAFLAARPEFAGVSVRVEGTYNGKSFVYTGAPRAEFETQFSPSLVADATPVNLTVHVDLAKWFTGVGGTLIDPSSTSSADMLVIADNIRRSFRAFHDDDRNDHDDAGEHR